SSHRNVLKLLTLGLIFHVIFIASVFDCYFTSPVVHGMLPRRAGPGEAKRVVLIVGDGLRADLLFGVNAFSFVPSSPKIVAPYLRDIIQTRGAFGVSHTRVPTESRPGHVAIIGMLLPNTSGWKTNPVNFDSIFNQSSHTFSFGSPDILPMFAQGATPGKVDTWSYDEEDEDFTKDATALDTWVLEQLQTLFQNASSNGLLDSKLRADKVVFFLHLLGLDTTGHSYRPHSKEYMNNIQVVDRIVQRTEELFSNFYHDAETSFIFTADHGMSEIGNHGDGDPDNTRTPLIAWGRGIRGPLPDIIPSSHDEYSWPWQLDDFLRRDVEQADLAPLMAALLGINYPMNSVGILPDQFVLRGVPIVVQKFKSSERRGRFIGRVLFHLFIVVLVLQCMVAAYTHRSLWSIGFVVMGIFWPYMSWPSHVRSQYPRLLLSWMSSCLVTGIFPLLSVNKREDLYTIMCGGAMILAVGIGWTRLTSNGAPKATKSPEIIQASFILLAMTITASSVKSLQAKQGLPIINQTSAWVIIVVSSIYPFISKAQHNSPTSRIISLFLGFGVCFVILSISVEGLFYAAFTCNLLLWIEVEAIVQSKRAGTALQNEGYEFHTDDIRIALFFLFFVQVAFFGTGKSFYLEPVYRLVPVFNPFLMAALLIFKIVAPYVILSAVFATLNAKLHLPPFSLFLVALTLTDGMTMSFFLNVTDTGSWLEIGQSISFFCITSLLLVWSAGICAAGEYLMVDTLLFDKSTNTRKLE
ncbi:alkaline phosphatase-like protein, partial [Suillus decipiens]